MIGCGAGERREWARGREGTGQRCGVREGEEAEGSATGNGAA